MNSRESGGVFAMLCAIIALVIFTAMPIYRGLAAGVSEEHGLGAAMVFLREEISSNESVATFLGIAGGEDGEDEFDLAAEVAAYIAEHTPDMPTFVLPLEGILTSPYGQRTDPFLEGDLLLLSERTEEQHNGIDISPTGSWNIRAAMDGEVIRGGSDPDGYGNYLILRHGDCDTLYAHCSRISAAVGDRVQAGDVIAMAGDTGRATGVHLHLEVLVNGASVDPAAYFGIFGSAPKLS